MAEEYNYQILIGIVKVIRPKGKPVIGVSDGRGKFVWIQEDKIITSHPKVYENWQTTVFAIDKNWNIQWKDENNWDDYKAQYPKKTIPIPQPIPAMFQQTFPQQPFYNNTATQPPNYPPQSTTAANNPNYLPQQPQYTNMPQQAPIFSPDYSTINPPQPQIQQGANIGFQQTPIVKETLLGGIGLQKVDSIEIIAKELTAIRQLLELYIKPPKLMTADNIPISNEPYVDEDQFYEELEDESNINKDDLPNLF